MSQTKEQLRKEVTRLKDVAASLKKQLIEAKSEHAAGQQESQQVPVAVPSSPQWILANPPNTNNPAHRTNPIEQFFERWKNTLGVLGVVAAIAVLIVYFLQLREMWGQAGAAEKQLSEMQAARKLDERAWMLPYDIIVDTNGAVTNHIHFSVAFKNIGKTPAVNTLFVINWTGNKNNIPNNDPPEWIGNGSLLAPNVSTTASPNDPPEPVIQAVMSGGIIYIYGTASYEDIFHSRHWTKFCYANNRFHELSQMTFDQAPIHNSTDDVETNNSSK